MKESWLKKTQKSYDHKLEKRKKKLQKEIEDLEANYREYPWDRYQRAIRNRQFELDEINASYNFDRANNIVRDLQGGVVMFTYDYFQGKKDAYNEFEEYADFMLNNNIISDDLYISFIKHIKNMQGVFNEMQELELEKMRKIYE